MLLRYVDNSSFFVVSACVQGLNDGGVRSKLQNQNYRIKIEKRHNH